MLTVLFLVLSGTSLAQISSKHESLSRRLISSSYIVLLLSREWKFIFEKNLLSCSNLDSILFSCSKSGHELLTDSFYSELYSESSFNSITSDIFMMLLLLELWELSVSNSCYSSSRLNWENVLYSCVSIVSRFLKSSLFYLNRELSGIRAPWFI